ncbi:hypothetical protein AGMMS50284_1970 [Clostridia bacterium]|nr:hypothetical protein AGMMS50284_1970 [Clostridia bacterium]
MKKAAIITMYHHNYNYGGQLQAYALQQAVETFGVKCEVIDCEPKTFKTKVHRFYKLGIAGTIKKYSNKTKLLLKKKHNPKFNADITKRYKRLDDFSAFIPHTPFCTPSTIKEVAKGYEYYITGSDQVWNPTWWNNTYFLDFAPADKKRIAYAASLGNPNLNKKDEAYMSGMLNKFAAVSVRELGAKDLIKTFWQGNVESVLDPTLLFNTDFWNKIAIEPELKEPYVFVYMPHSCPNDREKILLFCKNNNLRMVSTKHLQYEYKEDDEKYKDITVDDMGPKEWIGYIKNAKYVFTNSFHGTAFSLIYNKNFWAFDDVPRATNMPTGFMRLDSLLMQVDLTNRLCQTANCPSEEKLKDPIDYLQANIKLKNRREESFKFLQNALN